jgi:hypothetical protein
MTIGYINTMLFQQYLRLWIGMGWIYIYMYNSYINLIYSITYIVLIN